MVWPTKSSTRVVPAIYFFFLYDFLIISPAIWKQVTDKEISYKVLWCHDYHFVVSQFQILLCYTKKNSEKWKINYHITSKQPAAILNGHVINDNYLVKKHALFFKKSSSFWERSSDGVSDIPEIFLYSSLAHDVILPWAPSWLVVQITLAAYSEVVVSIN